ncbi:MAG: hypothetical protein ABSH48_07285 [Verrucomicrobiota bacterium]|jgi:hypothetical protein
MTARSSVRICSILSSSLGLGALLLLTTTTVIEAQVQCVETNKVKYLQPPNLAGFDISDSLGYVLADDFVCTNTGPITDIHIWGSWLNNVHGVITNFWLGIYSDVPGLGNPAGPPTPSHPGNLLWSESFSQGQFAESAVAASQEQFISPASANIIGPDSEAWYYCFYPTAPYLQTGSISAPVIYWLAAYAQGNFGPTYTNTPQYGWKTTFAVTNDTSVNTLWTGALPTNNVSWTPNAVPANAPNGGQPLDLAFMLATPTNYTPPSCCPDTNGVKYVQPPNLNNGIDVDAASVRGGVLADDFPCFTRGPITDIHLWGSWLNDQVDFNATFILSIWSDVPATPANGQPSHPGVLLWTQAFGPGEYDLCPYATLPEPFDDPNYNPPIPPSIKPFGGSTNLYYLCFYAFATNTFHQTGGPNSPTNYWLSVSEVPNPTAGAPFYFGWKSSSISYNDAAVASLNAPYPAPNAWMPLVDPQTGASLNFAFKINTATNTAPPVVCIETNGVKYVQVPKTIGGFDVWNTPYVLADDFVCTNPGPVTDIHLWGSWVNDSTLTNSITFWLGIYDDVPAGSANNRFSHPGTNLLWQQWFAAGQYAETIWTANADEQFLDPGPTNILGTDSVVWYYCFYPTNPFAQLGTSIAAKTYWLAAYAGLPVGIAPRYGWKTATNVLNDASVHAPWPGVPPTNNPGWTPTGFQPPTGAPFVPLDLAFKLTTPTNCTGPILIKNYYTNYVVLTWPNGILQAATNVAGPYADVPGATSPYTNITKTLPYKFYRLRCDLP